MKYSVSIKIVRVGYGFVLQEKDSVCACQKVITET